VASIRQKKTRTGNPFYEIRVSRGRGQSYLTKTWHPPEGWSKKAIDRELIKVSAEFERQVHNGEVISRDEEMERARQESIEQAKILTLRQYAERVFLPEKAVTLSAKTVYTYRWSLEKYVYPTPIADMKMVDITSAQLSALLLDFQKSGQAHASCVRLYAILSCLFASAFSCDTITINPMLKVSRPKPRKDELRKDGPETLSEAETARLLECMKGESLKWRCFVSLLIETGMRRGECCALQWSNINFRSGEIAVCGSLGYTPEKGIYLTTPKSGHARTVHISHSLADLLRQLRKERALSQYVFTRDDSPEPMHPDSPTRYLKNLGARYGFDHLHPHLLRHTFASVSIVHGADIVSISEILGHADTSITLRVYSHASEESKKRASEIFLNAISK